MDLRHRRLAPGLPARWAGSAVLAACAAGTAAGETTTRSFFLYDDLPVAPWSGFMGEHDGASIALDLRAEDRPAAGPYHARMSFDGSESWAGIWVRSSPEGAAEPGVRLCAESLRVRLRSSLAGQLVELSAFDGQVAQVAVTVGTAWQREQIDLGGLSCDAVSDIVAIVVPSPAPGLAIDVDELALVFRRPVQAPTRVRLEGSGAPDPSWRLLVEGEPFEVRGVGYDEPRASLHAIDAGLAVEMHANTLRTWGPLRAGFALLDAAEAAGLYVVPGYWLLHGAEGRYADATFRGAARRSVRQWASALRDHPAVLLWSVGNEVYANLEPDTPAMRAGLTQLLDEIATDLHALDPHHPVTYAAIGATVAGELASTALDVYGANSYGGLRPELESWGAGAVSKPILFLEFGCDGWWERDWSTYTDAERADDYRARALLLKSRAGITLGGCAFAWQDKTEAGYTGWGIVNADRSPRPQWSALRDVYGGSGLLPRKR